MITATSKFVAINNKLNSQRWVKNGFRLLAIGMAGVHTWAAMTSYSMNADGISYLDIGDAYMRGDWNTAVNPTWSPLYSWIIGPVMALVKPSMRWEFPLTHLVNFAIYLFALVCFEFFWRQVRKQQQKITAESSVLILHDWAWWSLGYGLFIWTSLTLIEIWAVTPDMLMSALVYITAGLLVQLWLGNIKWRTFIVFGLVLGLGYLAKSIMFPMAFVFLGLSLFSTGSFRQAFPRVIVSAAAFLFIALPYVILISQAAGELTFGQSGLITYVRYVNGVSYPHWQGEPSGSGIPLHPSRQIFEHPAVYEFGEPIGGTYPISLNPVYWYEGVTAKLDLGQQLRLIMSSLLYYFDLFFHQLGVLLLGIFTFYMLHQRWRFSQKEIIQQWGLAVAAFAAFGLYALVLVEGRYIGVFVTVLFASLLVNVRLPNTQINQRLSVGISIMMVGFLLLNLITFNLNGYRDLTKGGGTQTTAQSAAPPEWPGEVAGTLHRLDVEPGDSVGVIGYGFDSFWARLARVHIAAEMLDRDADAFWDGGAGLRGEVMTAFAEAGVTAVVAEYVPENVRLDGWYQVGNSNYYIYIMP